MFKENDNPVYQKFLGLEKTEIWSSDETLIRIRNFSFEMWFIDELWEVLFFGRLSRILCTCSCKAKLVASYFSCDSTFQVFIVGSVQWTSLILVFLLKILNAFRTAVEFQFGRETGCLKNKTIFNKLEKEDEICISDKYRGPWDKKHIKAILTNFHYADFYIKNEKNCFQKFAYTALESITINGLKLL